MKKFLALFTLTAMLLASVVIPVSANTSNEAEIFSQNFETGFTTSMTTEQIATELGWATWDADVADLKIVETVYVREATSKLGLADVRDNADFKAAVAWNEGSNHEYENCNHRIVDIAALKQHISKAASVDFTQYTSYSKRLLIVPKAANSDISVMLKENIDISNLAIDESIVVDWEFTANKLTSFGWEADSVDVDFANTSSLGFSYTMGSDKVSAAIQADGALAQTATNGDAMYDGSVSWDDVYTAAGKKYGSGVDVGKGHSIKYTVDTTTDPITTVNGGSYMLYSKASANGLTFGMRTELSPYSGYTSYARTSYTNATGYPSTAWTAIGGDYALVTGTTRNLMKSSSTMDISLNYSSGMSFYLDNISVTKVKSGAETLTITVDGKDFTALAGQEIPVAALVDNIEGFLLAIGKDADNTEKVYALTDKITPVEGMSITPYTVDLSVSKAELRADEPVGIRWVTEIDKDSVAKLEDLKARGLITKVEIATLITPASYAESAGGATAAKLKALPTNFPYVLANATFGTWYESGESTYSFAGSVVSIIDAHKSMDYIGRGFITLTIPGEEGAEPTETVIYAPTDTSSVANAKQLATEVVNTPDNGLSDAVLAEIKKYMQ